MHRIWLLIFISTFNFAQDIHLLEEKLSTASGKERLEILHALAEAYEIPSPRDAVRHGEEGLTLAKELNDPKAIADFLGGLGFNYMNLGDYEKALSFQKEALARREDMGDQKNAAKSLNNIGLAYYYLGNGEKALEHHFRAMKLREAHGNRAGLAITLNSIGLVYASMNDYAQAMDYYEKSLILREELEDKVGATRVLSNLGSVLTQMARFEEALVYEERARRLAEEIGFENGMAYASYNLGKIFLGLNQPEEALSHLQYALVHYQKIDDLNGQALALTEIGKIHAQADRNEEALEALNKATILADKLQSHPRLKDAHEALAMIQERQGQFAEALDHYRAYVEQKEIIANEEVRKRMSELAILYDSESKAKEIEILKRDNDIKELSIKRQRLQRNSLIFGILLAIALAFFSVRGYRHNLKVNHLLASKNREVEAANTALAKANSRVNEKHDALQDAFLRLEHLARTDPLTGLSNRRDFWEKAQHEVAAFEEASQPFAVILGDLDHFKEVNDAHGHDAGDFVLCRMSEILRQRLRPTDLKARWGGEEFIALLPGADMEEASHISQRLRSAVRDESFKFSGKPIPVTITLGVSIYRGGALSECIKRADRALYQGKESTRDCVVFSD